MDCRFPVMVGLNQQHTLRTNEYGDEENEVRSIVFIARQLGRRGEELDILTAEEADELIDITDILLEK
ncbi:Hypothetical predicted protein [Mytilus galloprovincialis]|uniref:Uncharacterized protein n=1 Tax=Mytilus galloprovincialis TaxID=29158 RepID=A0A8B6H2D6_MYTGA|nr:Hypothetical predicted protein [Mytilus galloprovincialis]